MALFKKKGKDAAEQAAQPAGGVETTAQPAPAPQLQGKPKKFNNTMASVVKETNLPSAVAIMKTNKPFLLDAQHAVILLLDVNNPAFGGLSERDRKNEDKGQILQLITGDKIQHCSTQKMIASEFLGVMPTSVSLQRMEEFALLRDTPYVWGMVDLNSFQVTELGAPAKFGDAQAVADGRLPLATALSEVKPEVWQRLGLAAPGAAASAAQPQASVQPQPQAQTQNQMAPAPQPPAPLVAAAPPQPAPDEGPELEGDPDDEVDYTPEEDPMGPADDEYDEFDPDADDVEDSYEPEPGDDEPEPVDAVEVDDREVSAAQVHDSIVRRFTDDGVEVNIDLAPFQATFVRTEPMQFEIGDVDPDNPVQVQIAELKRSANIELARMHQDRYDTLQRNYSASMARFAQDVLAAVNDPDNELGKVRALLEQSNSENARKADATVVERKREIKERFEAELKAKGESARTAAESVFRERFGPRLDADLLAVSSNFEREREERYALELNKLNDTKRQTVNQQMELGVSNAMLLLADMHAEDNKAENQLFASWRDKIDAFYDAHRKDETVRAQVLAEEQRRSTRFEDQQAEFESRLAQIRDDHGSKVAQLEAQIAATKAEAQQQLVAAEERHAAELKQAAGAHQATRDEVTQLRNDIRHADERAEQRMNERITLADENAARASEQANTLLTQQNRVSKLWAAFLAIASLVALALGLTLGMLLGPHRAAAPAATVTQVAPASSQPTVTVTAQPGGSSTAQGQSTSPSPNKTVYVTQTPTAQASR